MPCERARRASSARESAADAASLPLVDDLEGDLRLRRVDVADVATDPDRAARLLVDGDDGLAAGATDVDEQVEVALVQARLAPRKRRLRDCAERPAKTSSTVLRSPLRRGCESDCGHETSAGSSRRRLDHSATRRPLVRITATLSPSDRARCLQLA